MNYLFFHKTGRRLTAGLLLLTFLLSIELPVKTADTAQAAGWKYTFRIKVGEEFFPVDLVRNAATKKLESRMALTLTMSRKGSTGVCRTFKNPFKVSGTKTARVEAGDIVLKGDSCLMLCYKTFKAKKKVYTVLGSLSDRDLSSDLTAEEKEAAMKERRASWKTALKQAKVKVTFSRYTSITQDEAMKMMNKRDDNHVIVDVRNEDEYAENHIPGAILIPLPTIGTERPEQLPDLNQIIMVYCRSGRRSKEASQRLASLGYRNIYEFGGINTWLGQTVSGSAVTA